MKYYFRYFDSPFGAVRNIICDAGGDRLHIFIDEESNTSFERQEYLAWVAEGNTAEEWTGE